jgi:hypothetical protein
MVDDAKEQFYALTVVVKRNKLAAIEFQLRALKVKQVGVSVRRPNTYTIATATLTEATLTGRRRIPNTS